MFCPPGYVTLNFLSFFFQKLEMRFIRSTGWWCVNCENDERKSALSSNNKSPTSHSSYYFKSQLEKTEAILTARIFHAWLVDACLGSFTTYLCSPNGVLLKVENELLSHRNEIYLVDWDGLNCPKHLKSALDISQEGSVFDGFTSFRYPCGIIDVERYDSLENGNNPAVFREVLGGFDGWAICFSEKEFPDGDPELLRALGFDEGYLTTADEDSAGSDSLAYVLECALEAYPDGKTDPWSTVEKKTGFSRRQINRALTKHGRTDWKMEAGQN